LGKRRLRFWQEEAEGRPGTVLVEQVQAATVRFGDRPAEREAQSGAGGIARAGAVRPYEPFEED
jgi:hypothetical protein